jgi:HlyD family secretion protein
MRADATFRLPNFVIVVAAGAVCLLAGTAFWRHPVIDPALTAIAGRGALTAQLTVTGVLRPAQSITYRSPLGGREAEIVELVPEGTRVGEGDLLLRLDTTDLQRELERSRQEVRQSQLELQVAEIDVREADAALAGVSDGEGALSVDELRTRLQLAEKRVERLRREHEQLAPLLDKGYITREELKRTADELEQSEQEAALARRRADVVTKLSYPHDRQRASLLLAQKQSALEATRAKAADASTRLKLLREQVEQCRIYARRAGLVVYEEFLSASPRRKIRIGDRVTGSQGIVTIPEVSRMLLEGSVSEPEVHRVRHGQPAVVRVEAVPDLRLTGRVVRVGSLARASADRPFEDKRFDVIVELDSPTGELLPEMSARADLVVGTRSGAVLLPASAIFDQQGQPVVHVVRTYGVETRPVELGESNDTLVEIVGGVDEGERVMLTDPGRSATGSAVSGARGTDRGRAGGSEAPTLQRR